MEPKFIPILLLIGAQAHFYSCYILHLSNFIMTKICLFSVKGGELFASFGENWRGKTPEEKQALEDESQLLKARQHSELTVEEKDVQRKALIKQTRANVSKSVVL